MALISGFQVGGAVREGAWYGRRDADHLLPERLLLGELGVVLAPRQMGKSSLRLRAAAALADHMRVAQVDLAAIGSDGVDAASWFGALAAEVAAELVLPEPSLAGAPVRAWLEFLGDALDAPTVLFVDELDVLRRVPFVADVFGALRAAHERGATDPRWARLRLCLIGAASPEALGSPLAVGARVELGDFQRSELDSLEGRLSPEVVDAIYAWTHGHPYMTARIGAALDDGPVDTLVERFFLAPGVGDTNLAAAERELTIDDGGATERVEAYRRVLDGPVPLREVRPALVDALVLSGMVALRGGALVPRNAITARVFDATWAERLLGRRAIRAAVVRWGGTAGRDDDLPRGQELAALRGWAEGRPDLSPDEHALLRRAAEVVAEERARRDAVERRVEAERVARARGWMVAALLVVGVALAGTSAGLVRAMGVARAEARRATELRLAAEAVALAGTPRLGEQALARALAASELDAEPDPPEVTRALAAALGAMQGRRLSGHDAPVVGVACEPGGRILSEGADGGVLRWSDGHPSQAAGHPGHGLVLPAEVEGPDDDGPVRLRRLAGPGAELAWEDGAVLRSADGLARPLLGHSAAGLRWAAFTDFGLLTVGHDDTLRRWDPRSGAPLGAFLLHTDEPLALKVCDQRVVTGAADGTVGVWELVGGAGQAVNVVSDRIPGAAWSGGSVLTVDRSFVPHRVDPWTGATVEGGGPSTAAWEVHPRGSPVFDGDHTWLQDANGIHALPGVGEPILKASWSADGRQLAGVTASGRVVVWEGERQVATYEVPAPPLTRPVFGPGGLAVGDDNGTVWLLGPGIRIDAHPSRVSAVAWSADGRLASASLDHSVRLWDGTRPVGRLDGHASHVRAVAWSPDGTRLATGGDDRTVRLWTDHGVELAVLTGHTDVVRTVEFSPDGEHVLSTADDQRVIVFPGSPAALVAAARRAAGTQ